MKNYDSHIYYSDIVYDFPSLLQDVSHLLDTNPEYFTTFNIVIASGLSERLGQRSSLTKLHKCS